MNIASPNAAVKTYKLKKIKQSFTTLLITNYQCTAGKSQTLYWDKDTPNLGLRITQNGCKSFIFEGSLNNKTIRITIGNVNQCSIDEARSRAVRLKSLVNQGIDPRQLANKKVANFISAKALALTRKGQSATVHSAWLEYLAAQKVISSAHRYKQLIELIPTTLNNPTQSIDTHLNGLVKLTLSELSYAVLSEWAEASLVTNPSATRHALKVLSGFFEWCNKQQAYETIINHTFIEGIAHLTKAITPRQKPLYLSNSQLANWFNAVNRINNYGVSTYLKVLLLTGRRQAEIAKLEWSDINFIEHKMNIRTNDKQHTIPLTPYVASLLKRLPKDHILVFNNLSELAGSDYNARALHRIACQEAGLTLSMNALRTSFTLFSEWVETPTGITAQIQDIDIKGISAHHFVERPIELLQKWHNKIEAWILEQAQIDGI